MILVAPTAFKGTISARAATQAMAGGVRTLGIGEVVELPLSDGGPGLLDAIARDQDPIELVTVTGPRQQPAKARVLRRDRQAVIESADACGLHLVPVSDRAPLLATSRGVGELIAAASTSGTTEIVIGLGGSATVDGGIGMAAALGWRFLDREGRLLEPMPRSLDRVARIEPPAQQRSARCVVLADVTTPLVGAQGAARVFGPQKGASVADVEWLDRALTHYADAIQRNLGIEVAQLAGTGAAGGLGAALHAFLGGIIVSGSAWVLEQSGFAALLSRTTLIIVGEGSYDAQSSLGKVTGAVIDRAAQHDIPVLLVAGSVSGPLPAHVRAVTGNGRTLTQADLRVLAADACARLLHL